jgi:Domain of unknown function (DUF4279)
MKRAGEPRAFRTLKGAVAGEEPDEPTYFAYRATLRIHGDRLPFVDISRCLGLVPTYVHRKGGRRGPKSPPHPDDAWHFQPALPESAPLEQHIATLWQALKPNAQYLRSLKKDFKVDVFCGYRSNCDHAGVAISHTCLELFTALEIPFGISIVTA